MKKLIGIFLIGTISFLSAGMDVNEVNEFWIWIALFALGIIAIFILFLSSRHMIKIQKLHKDMFDKQLEMEHSQSLFLESMSKNIHDIIEERSLSQISTADDDLFTLLEKSEQEHKLLDVTTDLIEFLRLKSKKVEIINEKFNLNNVLNEVSGSICSAFKGSNVELIFDIDNNIPRYMIGDSRNLEKILNNFLEYTMSQFHKVDKKLEVEVKLEIAMFDSYKEKLELQFKLMDTGKGVDPETLETLFVPNYDEKSNEYTGLGLFVAKELITVMHGELAVQSVVGKGTTFTLSLPFSMVDAGNKRNYRLPEKILTTKKVFIVDSNYNSALAIKKMFSYFKHDVKVVTKKEFVKNMYNLTIYDIVILDEVLLNIRTVDYLTRIKKEKDLKVIVLHSLLQENEISSLNPIADKSLAKPLNQERVFELIIDMYGVDIPGVLDKKEEITDKGILTYRSAITEEPDITQENFSDFNGMHLLIVEDNIINQKVLANVLILSGINISIANNGSEAVDMIKGGRKKFDLVLMDINMPVMDGYVATQMIRLKSEFDKLPIVAFTALALESEKQKIFKSGMNAFLTKPLKMGELYSIFKLFVSDMKKGEKIQHPKIAEQTDTLDTQAGISYSNNSQPLYIEILKEFIDAYGESSELFPKLVREHRYEQIKMLCLDMKGLTGTIGATDMHKLINEIHQDIVYNKQELLPKYIETYQKELYKLNESIERYIGVQ